MSRVTLSPSSSSLSSHHWTQLCLGIAFTTLATLVLELALTRIFSVVFYYHFAFLAISVALFGLGAGGVFSYVVAARTRNLFDSLGKLALANSFVVVAALWFILSRTGDPDRWTLAAVYFVSALPFFLSGIVVSLAINEAIERIDRAYFFDLAGAAVGCLLLVPFLNVFGGPNTIIAAAVLYTISAAIWFHHAGQHSRRATAVLSGLLLVTLMVMNGSRHWIDLRTAKGQKLPEERFVAWNNISRIGVQKTDVSWEAQNLWTIIIDGDAGTGISPFDWDKGLTDQERAGLLNTGPGFPYALRPGAKTLVIGSGGGYDLARALAGGSKDVTAVEINPIIANKVMRGAMIAESHGIYLRPEVHVNIEDGRSFVRRSQEKYQVLQATLVDTWASTAAGAFSLSENNLYTADAFYDYMQHITDDGVLAFTRWGFDPPRESLRVVALGMDALSRLGEKDPSRHVIVLREDSTKLQGWGALDTLVISRKPFSDADIARAKSLIAPTRTEAVYLPGTPGTTAFHELLSAKDPQAFYQNYRYDVSPVTDDRPFFFYTVQPRDLLDFLKNANVASADYKVNRAVPLLFALMGISVVATLLVLLLPRVLLGHRLPKQKGVMTFLTYFVCLGAGYILIQVALIQKFVLLLGHPTYALTVIVFSMLVASGVGSYVSSKAIGTQDSRLIRALAAIFVLVAALALIAPPLVSTAATWPLAAKMAVTGLVIFPAAFLMGMPFPCGLRRLEEMHAPSVRWAWSLNAASSVLGSAGAIFLAIYLGLRNTMLVGASLYLLAMAVIFLTRKNRMSQLSGKSRSTNLS